MKLKAIICTILIVIVLIFGIIIGLRTISYPIKYKDLIIKYSKKYNLDPYLVCAIIEAESGFNKDAMSHKEARGLMQIAYKTAEEINIETKSTPYLLEDDLFNPNINIDIGSKYLASLISRYNGNYYLAICAYNAGIGNVNKWIDSGVIDYTFDSTEKELPFGETTKYLRKVIHNYNIYKIIYRKLQ